MIFITRGKIRNGRHGPEIMADKIPIPIRQPYFVPGIIVFSIRIHTVACPVKLPDGISLARAVAGKGHIGKFRGCLTRSMAVARRLVGRLLVDHRYAVLYPGPVAQLSVDPIKYSIDLAFPVGEIFPMFQDEPSESYRIDLGVRPSRYIFEKRAPAIILQ